MAFKIGIVLRSIALSDDEGDVEEAPQAPTSKTAGAMDELTHEMVEIGAKSAQEQMLVGAKQLQEQAPPKKSPAPKPQTTRVKKKKTGDIARGPEKPKRAPAA